MKPTKAPNRTPRTDLRRAKGGQEHLRASQRVLQTANTWVPRISQIEKHNVNDLTPMLGLFQATALVDCHRQPLPHGNTISQKRPRAIFDEKGWQKIPLIFSQGLLMGALGAVLRVLGCLFGTLVSTLGDLGRILSRVGAILGSFWGRLQSSWALWARVTPCVSPLRVSWVFLMSRQKGWGS